MAIRIWKDNGKYDSSTAVSVECLKSKAMQIGLYTLQDKEHINIVPDDYEVTSSLILLEGTLIIQSKDKTYEIHSQDAAMLENIEESYYVEAKGFVKLFIVTSEDNQEMHKAEVMNEMRMEVEQKDVYTLGHSRRVALYATQLALAYEATYNVIILSMAAHAHDVGKIHTPIEILQKPGKLTSEEYEIIKQHPVHSYELIKEQQLDERVAIAARQHHERLDGSGYPDGLRGFEIGMDARILAIADVFDAMTCKRIYNEPLPPIKVVEYLEENLDKYDPVIISILRKKVENGELNDIVTAYLE